MVNKIKLNLNQPQINLTRLHQIKTNHTKISNPKIRTINLKIKIKKTTKLKNHKRTINKINAPKHLAHLQKQMINKPLNSGLKSSQTIQVACCVKNFCAITCDDEVKYENS